MNILFFTILQFGKHDSNQRNVWLESWVDWENKSLPLEMWFESQDLLTRIRTELDSNRMIAWLESCMNFSFRVHIGTGDSNKNFLD